VLNTDIHALVGAYALDAIDDLERAAFDRHLADCESCRAEVDELRETAGRLADSTWSVPPPRLRTDVLAAIGRTRQVAPGEAAPAERDAGAVSRWRRFTAGAAAAGILAAGAGAATWAVQEQRVRHQTAVATAALATEQQMQRILGARDLQVKTTFMRDGGKVTMMMSPNLDAGVVTLAADAALPSDKAFQLWTINAAGPKPGDVTAPGASWSVQIVEGLLGVDELGVTIEPAGGSATPTDLVAKVSLI
jgi:anti-sigma-K factor RskA